MDRLVGATGRAGLVVLGGDAVSVEVVKPRNNIRIKVWVINVEKVAECVSQFVLV